MRKEVNKQMANFFKGYGVKAYQEKHKGESVEEIQTAKLKGFTAPDPKTLKNKKSNRYESNPMSEDENI